MACLSECIKYIAVLVVVVVVVVVIGVVFGQSVCGDQNHSQANQLQWNPVSTSLPRSCFLRCHARLPQRNSLGGALRDNQKNGCGDTKGTCHSVRIKRALREKVRSTCFIDIKTKADNFTRKRYLIS